MEGESVRIREDEVEGYDVNHDEEGYYEDPESHGAGEALVDAYAPAFLGGAGEGVPHHDVACEEDEEGGYEYNYESGRDEDFHC